MQRGQFRYRAFISYSHTDRQWARRVSRLLETWRVPRRLVGTQTPIGPVPRTLGPVFRDRDELPASSELGSTIAAALEDSASLVVVCSPAAARSRWVNEEIRTFKALGRADRIFALVVAGDPGAEDGPEQCFPPALRFQVDASGRITNEPAEPVAADARPEGDGPRRARLKLLAGLLGVGYDSLRQREQKRRNQRLVAITAASVIGMAITLGLAVSARIAQEDAERRRGQAEALINYLVGDLHSELRTIGRTDVLESLGDEAMKYFASLSTRDLNDDLLARQAQALTQIGEVRIDQGRLDAALESLQEAYERAAELVARHPGNGDLLFDRAQAEFYVGFVYWTHKDLGQAERWLTTYRDTTRKLAELDPGRLEWVREGAYGEYNLGVLSFEREQFEKARDIFASQLRILESLQAAGVDPKSISRDVADAWSWRGSVAENLGDLGSAERYFRQALDAYGETIEKYPEDRTLGEEQANVMVHLGRILAATGQAPEAMMIAERAAELHGSLARLDPDNMPWQRQYYLSRRMVAELAFAAGDRSTAMAIYDDLRSEERSRAAGEEVSLSSLLKSLPLRVARARSELDHGAPAVALEEARAAVDMAERQAEDSSASDDLAQLALALTLRGSAARATGDTVSSQEDFRRAYDLLESLSKTSRAWFVLDPFARAAILAGHPGEAGRVIEDLRDVGYRPLWPWPDQA